MCRPLTNTGLATHAPSLTAGWHPIAYGKMAWQQKWLRRAQDSVVVNGWYKLCWWQVTVRIDAAGTVQGVLLELAWIAKGFAG